MLIQDECAADDILPAEYATGSAITISCATHYNVRGR